MYKLFEKEEKKAGGWKYRELKIEKTIPQPKDLNINFKDLKGTQLKLNI